MSIGKSFFWGVAIATYPVGPPVAIGIEVVRRTSLRTAVYASLALGMVALTPAAIGALGADVSDIRPNQRITARTQVAINTGRDWIRNIAPPGDKCHVTCQTNLAVIQNAAAALTSYEGAFLARGWENLSKAMAQRSLEVRQGLAHASKHNH